MLFNKVITSVLAAVSSVSAAAIEKREWKGDAQLPLNAEGRYIVDSNGDRVKLRCANWPGHMEFMIPEGLQHQSVESIAQSIKDMGLNCVRLTYSIDMALDKDVTIRDSFSNAVPSINATEDEVMDLYDQVVSKNSWVDGSTRIQAYDKVARVLSEQGILVDLNNHVSRSTWCCDDGDGDGFWGDKYFDTDDWIKGLQNMAEWTKSHPNVVAMSLRNEPRSSNSDQTAEVMSDNFVKGSKAVGKINSDLLIVFSGMNFDTDLKIYKTNSDCKDSAPGKAVFDVHWYKTTESSGIENNAGFMLEEDKNYTAPLYLSEWGLNLDEYNGSDAYADALIKYATDTDLDFAFWGLQRSYYYREGELNFAETFALLSNDWSSVRNEQFMKDMNSMLEVSQGPGV